MNKLTLDLTKDEALVLFEILSRYSESETLEVSCQADKIALCNTQAAMEKILAKPFSSDYQTELNAARKRLEG